MAAPPKKTKYSKTDAVNINIGLEQVYPNPDDPSYSKASTKLALDIVAIPGLGANPEWTWVREKVHWLRDSNMLARRVPNARISVLNFQSQWFGKGSVDQRLENVADQLLYQLERSRGDDNKTPIIFVCHCLGGIILERALLTARLRQNDFPSIFPYVAGSVFLGTPFRGTKSQNKAMILADMAESIGMGVPSGLLKLLEKDSEALLRMLDEFVRLSNDAQMRIFCFFESQKSDLTSLFLKGLPTAFKTQELIVDKDSATYSGVEALQLASDHFKLNKFTGPKDGNFISVSNEIKVTAQKAAGIIKSRQNILRQSLINDRTYHAIIDALGKGFSDIDATIKGSYKGPKGNKMSWVVDTPNYQTWREGARNPLLWIHGKAGTGQGSIASSVIECLHGTKEQGEITVSFFCDQSDENRRSLRGLLVLLIRQIINENQDLAVHLLTDSKKGKNAGKPDFDPESLTKVSTLWEALQAMAKDLNPAYLNVVVYGLEQLSTDSIIEFSEYMKDIPMIGAAQNAKSSISPVKWLLLSRSGRPDIEKSMKSRALEINIDDTENLGRVSDALRSDISARVDDLGFPSAITYFIKRHIHSRAEDNYVYVSLAIQELKNAQGIGKVTHAEIRALLESFPYGLTDMYEHIRKRVLKTDAEGIEHTKEILRCMIASQRAPTMRELAIMADLPTEHRDDLDELKSHIIRCGAFITLRGNELDEDSNFVEWIDTSAPEHLQKFAKDDLSLDLIDMQHGIIGLRCLQHVYELTDRIEAAEEAKRIRAEATAAKEAAKDDEKDGESGLEDIANMFDEDTPAPIEDVISEDGVESHEDLDEAEPKTNEDTDVADDSLNDDANLQYPCQYWLEHAKRAPPDVIEEFRTAHIFWRDESPARQNWWKQNPAMHALPDQADVSALHIATIAAFPALIDHLLSWGWEEDIHKEDSLGNQPLFYACSGGHYEIVQTLLGAKADINYVSNDDRVTALYGAATNGHKDIVELLLDRDADCNANSDTWGTPLYAATDDGNVEIMRLLIKRGANVNLVGGAGRRPLNIAAFNGNAEAVGVLIDSKADVDPDEEYWYGSALGAAARRGHADVVKLLLGEGWSHTKSMKTYGSFLTAAATYGHLDVVEALVQKETRITVLEQALQAAAQNGKASVVKLILDRTPTLRHQKAFMLAAFYGRDDVLQLLFPRGIPQEKLDAALYDAADHEHEETVKLLLKFGASPDAEGAEYGCALTASAYDGTKGILQALISAGANVNKRGGEYGTALQAAAFYGDAANVKLLLDNHAEVNTPPIGTYGNPLQAACYCGDQETIKLLIEHGADVNASGGEYGYAIIAAADEADGEVVKLLLEHDANVNVRGLEDNLPLIAIAGGTLLLGDVQLILDKGADINAQCDKGTTALINCAAASDKEGLEFLLEKGANLHISSEELGTALHAAATEGDEVSCKLLLDHGARVNAFGGTYGTALQAAAFAYDLDTVKVLLDANADVDIIGGEYGCALQAAAFSGHDEIVRELLITHGAIVDNPGGKYGYALQAAAAEGHTDIVTLLLENGADVNRIGGLHGTSLLAAAATKDWNDDVIELLLDHGADVKLEGGLYHSAAQAAAVGNTVNALELFIEKDVDIHSKGGKYGSVLQAAALRADTEFLEVLLKHNVDVNYQGGKYGTALQAAAYADKLDVVRELLDKFADFRIRGGKYGTALTAAAVCGNKAVLDHFLKMRPPEQMLDESLAEACYHRQTGSVEALLKSGANVYARHPTLGLPIDALRAEAPDGYNSDDEREDPDEDDSDSEDEEDDDESEEAWEGDEAGSVAGDTEGSVTDLQLEEEVTEESKIQKLLDDAMARVKRNPTMQRFRTVKRRSGAPYGYQPNLPAGGGLQGAQMQNTTNYTQFNPPPPTNGYVQGFSQSSYHNLPQQSQEIFQAYPGASSRQYENPQVQQAYQQPFNNNAPAYTPYTPNPSQAPTPPAQYQATTPPPLQQSVPPSYGPPQGQYTNPAVDPHRQYTTPPPPGYGTPPPPPSRMATQDPPLNPGPAGRYQQQQQVPPQQRQSTYPGSQSPYSTPPLQHQYTSPPVAQSQFTSTPPTQQYNPLQPPAQPGYTSPPPQPGYGPPSSGYKSPPHSAYQSPQPPQGQFPPPNSHRASYTPYSGTPQHSQSSFTSSHHALSGQSTPYGGSQQNLGTGYPSPNSSVQSGFSYDQAQGQKPRGWGGGGGYDGEGYG